MHNLENIKNNRDKKSKFVQAISSCLYDVKAYDLPRVCLSYGLEDGEENEAYSSKNSYIRKRIEHKSLEDLIILAEKVLHDYHNLPLENLLLLENESTSANKKITNLTLLDLADYLDEISLYGRLNPEDFLLKIKERFIINSTEKMDIINSVERQKYNNKWFWFYSDAFNQWRWLDNSDLIKEILELIKLPQIKIFSFIELLVSPELRRKEEAVNLVEKINQFIGKDGFLLKEVGSVSGNTIVNPIVKTISFKKSSDFFTYKIS